MCRLAWCPQCCDKTLRKEFVFPVPGEDNVTMRDWRCDACGYLFSRVRLVKVDQAASPPA